jgi:hypothetical protein
MKLEYVPSQKEDENLSVGGFIYQVKHRNVDGSIRWRCKFARKKGVMCPAAISSHGTNLKVPRDQQGNNILPEHTHDPVTSSQVAIICMRDACKKQARSSVKASLKSIINTETHKLFKEEKVAFGSEAAKIMPVIINIGK